MNSFYYEVCVRIKESQGGTHNLQILDLLANKALEFEIGGIEMLSDGFVAYFAEDYTLDLSSFSESLRKYSDELQEIFNTTLELVFAVAKKNNQDWIEKYRQSIQPVQCGIFYIHPSWFPPINDKINLTIDPALAFGSGHHATTASCLEILSEFANEESPKTFLKKNFTLENKHVLDVGCGSGILSLAASACKALVWACDTDKLAIEQTQKNANLNHLEIANLWCGTLDDKHLTKMEFFFDIIMANLLADIIVTLPLDKCVKNGGFLILSGILEIYVSRVLAHYSNMHLVYSKNRDEWSTLVLTRD